MLSVLLDRLENYTSIIPKFDFYLTLGGLLLNSKYLKQATFLKQFLEPMLEYYQEIFPCTENLLGVDGALRT